MKKSLAIACLVVCALMSYARAFSASDAGYNTGFVRQDIWYSKSPLAEGDTVSIYTALFNGRKESLSAKVVFYDGSVLLGTASITVLGYNVATASITWNVTAGEHSIYAAITEPTISVNGKSEPIFLADAKTEKNTFSIRKTVSAPDATAIAPDVSDTAGSDSAHDSKIDAIVSSVIVPASAAGSSVDAWRADTAVVLVAKKDEASARVADAAKTPATAITVHPDGATVVPSADVLKTPFAYAKVFFFTVLAYVFEHSILFYSLCGVIAFLLIRTVWRRFR